MYALTFTGPREALRPASTFKRLDLPAPEGPRIAHTEPPAMAPDTFDRIGLSPTWKETSCHSRVGPTTLPAQIRKEGKDSFVEGMNVSGSDEVRDGVGSAKDFK